MKNFSSRTRASSHRSFRRGTAVKIILAVVIAVALLYFARSLIGNISASVTAPVYGVRNWFMESSATIPSYFRDRASLIAQIEELERTNARESGRNLTFSKLLDENEELRSLLSMETPERIGAGVLARPPAVPYDVLLIDRGSAHGVEEGAAVFAGRDRVIGSVAYVFERSALVELFTSVGVESTVYIIGPDIYTNAYGEGGGTLRVSVPQGIDLAKGNLVVLPSIESGLLGQVSAIESIPTKPEQNGFVVYEEPIQSIRFVSVSAHAQDSVSFEEAERNVEAQKARFLEVDVPDEVIVESTSATGTATGTVPADSAIIESE